MWGYGKSPLKKYFSLFFSLELKDVYNGFWCLDEEIHPIPPSIKVTDTGVVYLLGTGICSNMKHGTAIEP